MKLNLISILITCALVGCGDGGEGDSINTLQSQIIKSQVVLQATKPNSGDLSDLDSFGASVGNSRIVILTESMHGDANVMDLNSRLIQYLYQKKGFEVLLLESGMYELARMRELKEKQNVSYADSAAGRVFYYYSRTQSGRQMITFAEMMSAATPKLELAGIDVFEAGVESTGTFIPRLTAFLTGTHSKALNSADWPAFLRTASLMMQADPGQRPGSNDLAAFNRVIPQLENELCPGDYGNGVWLESTGFWCRMVESMKQESPNLWNASGSFDYPARDIAAAANTRWLLDGPFKGKKVILMTHALHGIINSAFKGYVNTASELARYYPGQIHTSLVTNSSTQFAPKPTESDIEYYLKTSPDKPKYLSYPSNSSDQNALKNLTIRENGYIPTQPNHFGSSYGSLFYFPDSIIAVPEWGLYPVKYW